MVKSDHSEAEEIEDMDTLELSSDSIEKIPNKRPRVIDSEDEDEEQNIVKKRRGSFNEKSEILKQDSSGNNLNQNSMDECNIKKEKNEKSLTENGQNMDSLFNSNVDKVHKEKQENDNENLSKNDDHTVDKSSAKENNENIKIESKDSLSKELTINTNTVPSDEEKAQKGNNGVVKKEVDEVKDIKEENEENETVKKRIHKNRNVDTEVVDGLELSVECASEEGSSSENEDEKDAKPRSKTIIVKAEPNESELECSSSEKEKSDLEEIIETIETKPGKKKGRKRGPQTNFGKLKASGSEDSENNNSDEDYSPRTKKKMKKSSMTKRGRRPIEFKKGRGGAAKKNYKKDTEDVSDDEKGDETLADRINKATKIKEEEEEELSEKESLASKSESNSTSEEDKSTKNKKRRRSNAKPEDNKQIQMLKKYLSAAGVKVRCYSDIWSDCKSNAARIKRLRELLEKNGVNGRPTLRKCKQAKEENKKIREISELDTSNIISEGRITRARRNMNNNKRINNPDMSPRHRETRNTYKRIQNVIDSDSD